MEKYKAFFTPEYLMGPNCVRLLGGLLEKLPAEDRQEGAALDLGCGKGLTSYVLAKETGYSIYANDLWIDAQENAARFQAWGMGERIIPVREDANDLHFDQESFDALISVDSYHYFAGKPGFFEEKILPFLKRGGMALIAVPGVRDEFEERTGELLSPWLGDEAGLFHGPAWWKRTIGESDDIADVLVWEMDCFDAAWEEWLRLKDENPFAAGDFRHYETIIRPYTNFVGMMIRKK